MSDREYYTFSPEVQEGLKAFAESNYRFGQEIGTLLNELDRGHQFEWTGRTLTHNPDFDFPINPRYVTNEREILIEALEGAIKVMEHAEALNRSRIYFTYEIDDSDVPF